MSIASTNEKSLTKEQNYMTRSTKEYSTGGECIASSMTLDEDSSSSDHGGVQRSIPSPQTVPRHRPSDSDWTTLNQLIDYGQLTDVRQWFQSRNLGSNAREHWTFNSVWPLQTAARSGRVEILNALPHYGFHCWDTHYFGDGLMHTAAAAGHVDMVERLTDMGLHVNMRDEDDNTPLHFAARSTKDNSQMITFLLKNQADPNDVNIFGETPLHMATGRGSLSNVLALLQAEADVNSRTPRGESPLLYAIQRSNDTEEHVRVLCDSGAASCACQGKYCEFYASCSLNNLSVILLLLEMNFCTSCNDKMINYTPLYNLIATTDTKIMTKAVDIIIEAGYDISAEITWIKDLQLYPSNVRDKEELRNQLMVYATTPRPLRQLSCLAIRKILGSSLPSTIDYLPLPDILKDTIKLKHVL